MKTHREIDQRSLALARAVVAKIDGDPGHRGLDRARDVCRRWVQQGAAGSCSEWQAILDRPWDEVWRVLLDESHEGQRLRQSDPFCGVLTPRERWEIYRKARRRETQPA
jgi:hypothetical protein